MNAKRAVPSVLAALVAAVFVVSQARIGDYAWEAGPALTALVTGRLHEALSVPFYMGLLAILARAPFVWLATQLGGGAMGIYRAGVAPCVAAALVLGLALARPRRRSEGWLLVVPVLAVLSPPALNAVRIGHPEQILCGTLAVAAVLLALSGRGARAGLALGLAIGTKQDAVIAIVPVLLASRSEQRRTVAVVGAATTAVLYGFMLAVVPHALLGTNSTLLHYRARGYASFENLWFPFSHSIHLHFTRTFTRYTFSPGYGRLGRVVSVLAQVPLGYLLWHRRATPTSALALLALLMLIRCATDPVDFDYFHVSFFLALLAWEVEARRLWRGVPPASLTAAFFLWLTFGFLGPGGYSPWLVFALYIGWAAATTLYLLGAVGLVARRVSSPESSPASLFADGGLSREAAIDDQR